MLDTKSDDGLSWYFYLCLRAVPRGQRILSPVQLAGLGLIQMSDLDFWFTRSKFLCADCNISSPEGSNLANGDCGSLRESKGLRPISAQVGGSGNAFPLPLSSVRVRMFLVVKRLHSTSRALPRKNILERIKCPATMQPCRCSIHVLDVLDICGLYWQRGSETKKECNFFPSGNACDHVQMWASQRNLACGPWELLDYSICCMDLHGMPSW